MKIGIDCRLWRETGVGRYIRNLVLNLQKLDKKNEYILFVLSKDYDQIISHFSSLNFHLVKTNIRWHTVAEQLKFPSILNRENLDLMHFPYFSVPIFYNRPFVITIHDLIMHHFSTGQASTHSSIIYKMKLLGYKYVINRAAKKARKIIAVSNATKQEIVSHLKVNPKKIIVTYEGADSLIQNSKIKMQNYNSKFKIKDYFLYVGNAYPHKNLDRMLEAFLKIKNQKSKIKNTTQNLKLVLVGKEDYFYKRLKKKVEELNLSDEVVFLQNISDGELSNLYKNALAFVTPSLMEGFGLPALEAMANNCLVLSSDIPSLREVCGNAALYFNPLIINEIADKLNIVTPHTTEYERLGELRKRGIERVKQFSWQKMAKETLGVYEQVNNK